MTVVNLEHSPLRLPLLAAFTAVGAEAAIGTEHLLAALATRGRATEFLTAVEVTPTVARALASRSSWNSQDSAEPVSDTAIRLNAKGAAVALTPAAAAAFERCSPSAQPTGLLLELLADGSNRATELLRLAEVDPEALRAAVRRGARPAIEERVEPLLRPTRDALIGRTRYGGRGLLNWFRSGVGRIRVNYARTPVLWTRFESDEQARRRGRRNAGSDDVLLALLATHEVAERYPFLKLDGAGQYQGGRALAGAGVRYREALRVAESADLGPDPGPLRLTDDAFPPDTGVLLDALVAGESNRATRLLLSLGVNSLNYDDR